MSLNRITIKGNLTRNPVLRYTPKGTAICDFGLAHNENRKDANGETITRTIFIDVIAWSGLAETLAKHFTKGKPIIIDGALQQEQWTDKVSSQVRTKILIRADGFDFAGDKRSQDTPPPSATPNPATTTTADLESDDIPF